MVPRVCKIGLRDAASTAWTATARCVAYRAPASPRRARRGLRSKEPPPPPPTAYQRLRSRRDAHRGLPEPGHATHSRTLGQREASAINDWRRCPRGTREHTRSSIGSGRSPRTLQRSPSVWKLPRAQNKGCPSQRHRRGATTKTTTKDGPPAAPKPHGPRRRRFSLQQLRGPREPQRCTKSARRRVGFVYGQRRREYE